MSEENKEYLGDGVYAAFDGYQVWVTVEDGINTTERIALDIATFEALKEYAKKCYNEAANQMTTSLTLKSMTGAEMNNAELTTQKYILYLRLLDAESALASYEDIATHIYRQPLTPMLKEGIKKDLILAKEYQANPLKVLEEDMTEKLVKHKVIPIGGK